MGLNQKRRTKKRLPDREPQPLEVPAEMNHTWSFDFMSDALYSGRRFRCLNIIDEGTREALGVVPDTSLPAARVVRELEQIGSVRGLPQRIRIDNGSEMLGRVFTDSVAVNIVRAFHHAASSVFTGVSQTAPTGSQLRVLPDQRRGLACLAAV